MKHYCGSVKKFFKHKTEKLLIKRTLFHPRPVLNLKKEMSLFFKTNK